MQAQCKHRDILACVSETGRYLWYFMRVGKLVPVSQCRKLLRGTGYISSMMLRQQAHPHPAPTLYIHRSINYAVKPSSGSRVPATLVHHCSMGIPPTSSHSAADIL